MTELEAALLSAHAAQDRFALVDLYARAAQECEGDADRAAFFLTHAYVFALEAGHPKTQMLHAVLINAGREAPLNPPTPPLR